MGSAIDRNPAGAAIVGAPTSNGVLEPPALMGAAPVEPPAFGVPPTALMELDPRTKATIRGIAQRLRPFQAEIVEQWQQDFAAFSAQHLPDEQRNPLRCGPDEFDLIIGSLPDLSFRDYYVRIAEAAQHFTAQSVSYESLTAWVHLLEEAYLPFLTGPETTLAEFQETIMSLDALLHNDFAIIASAYFWSREQEIMTRNTLLSKLNEENARLYQAELVARQEAEKARARQNQLLMRLITAQEDERRRISMEIHDGPTQGISAVLLGLQTCRELAARDPARAVTLLEELESSLRHNVGEMRRLISDLRPPGLDDIGLVAALKQCVREFSGATGIAASCEAQGDSGTLDPRLSVFLFRIAQECLSNVRKHARATSVRIAMEFTPEGRVRLTVSDNGKGFALDLAEAASGRLQFGIMGMKERTEMLSGDFRIVSAPGRGTRVQVDVPRSSLESRAP